MESRGTAVAERIPLSERDRAAEAAFLGLRRLEGVDLAAFAERYGVDLLSEYRDGLSPLFDAELLDVHDGRLSLTRRGLVLSNEVFAAFV